MLTRRHLIAIAASVAGPRYSGSVPKIGQAEKLPLTAGSAPERRSTSGDRDPAPLA